MTKLRWIAILAFAAALAFACGANPDPTTSPTRNLSSTGLASYQATKVVKALDVLRDIAISAEQQNPKLLSTENTRKVVRYHESAIKTIGAVPSGWKVVVLQGLNELSQQVPIAEWRQLEPFANLIRVVVSEVQP